MAIILMDDVFTMKFGQNVQNKILFTYLQACLANCLEVIKEKPGGGGGRICLPGLFRVNGF